MTDTVPEQPILYRYPTSNLWPDYARAALGVGLLVVPFIYSIGAHWLVTLVLGALLALFASFGLSTALRNFSVVLADRHGLRLQGPRPVSMPWNEVSDVDLRYFSTRRERDKGWFQLKVTGRGGKIKADSNLDDFNGLLRHVAAAVSRHDLPIRPIARENFAAAGFRLGPAENASGEGM
jgi:hypothetical protein